MAAVETKPITNVTTVGKKIVPWGLHPMYKWVEDEIKDRAKEYNINPVEFSQNSTVKYAGPRTAWIRVFSNGISRLESDRVRKNGFMMGGAETFEESYGFNRDGKITIGVDSYGNPHEIDAIATNGSSEEYDFPHRPPPSIVSMTCEFSGAAGSAFNALCRKTTVYWRCYSLNQLNYLIPYFLTPRMSLVVEWGWNHYNRASLIDLTDIKKIKEIWENKDDAAYKKLEESNGNYDFSMGFIVDYGYKLAEDGGYDCHTTILNPNFLIEGLSYQDSTTEKKIENGSREKMKDFIEFADFDMKSIGVKKATIGNRLKLTPVTNASAVVPPVASSTFDFEFDLKKEQVFSDGGKTWIRMDVVVDIINGFFSRDFKDDSGNSINVNLTKFDISGRDGKGIPICAHPAIKSTSGNILIPNETAPRFANPISGSSQQGELLTTAPNNYNSLFQNTVIAFISKNNYSLEFDNIKRIINADRSFPVFEKDYSDGEKGFAPRGYYGYLNDVYVSIDLLKEEIKKQDTVLRLIESILQHISRALCDMPQFKIVTTEYNNKAYSVIDVNFSTINTRKQAETLPKFKINAAEAASIRNARFEIKISPDMMNNMIMLSANQEISQKQVIRTAYDPKFMKYDDNAEGDRLFSYAESLDTGPSRFDDGTKKAKTARLFTEENKDFVIYEETKTRSLNAQEQATINTATAAARAGGGSARPTTNINTEYKIKHIIAETNSQFLKNVIIDINNMRAIYTNNGIMPGTEFHADLMGIGGITYLSQFTLDHVPKTYSYEKAVWQIADVKQKVENKIWTTSVMAQARPLVTLQDGIIAPNK